MCVYVYEYIFWCPFSLITEIQQDKYSVSCSFYLDLACDATQEPWLNFCFSVTPVLPGEQERAHEGDGNSRWGRGEHSSVMRGPIKREAGERELVFNLHFILPRV